MPEPPSASRIIKQSAVIPYQRVPAPDGLKILLITSMRRRRWVIPKGIIEPNLSPAASAVKEAYEEAGIKGDVSGAPIGRYTYSKWGGTCVVSVFLLEVRTILEVWPEAAVRQRRWLPVHAAAQAVAEPDLREMILAVPELVRA
jgi:8-oxo-dGTP pyrophosphatase MutT (NUDIX family)